MPPNSAPQKTVAGNTYFPNTFQVPNVVADRLATTLPDSAYKVLILACRKILGFEEHRQTLRDRISRSQMMTFTDKSYNTVTEAASILERANILLPVGPPNGQGQEYELNLGQHGDYAWDYLESLVRRGGNPNPVEARQAKAARALQDELLPDLPDMGGQPLQNLKLQNLKVSNEISSAPYLIRQGELNSLDTQKPKTINRQVEIPEEVVHAWIAAKSELQMMISKSSFDTWLRDTELAGYDPASHTFSLLARDVNVAAYLTNSMTSTLSRTLSGITRRAALVKILSG